MIQTPEQRGNGHIEHGEVLAEHVFLLGEDRHHLGQPFANDLTRLFCCLEVLFQRLDVGKNFPLHGDQQLPRAGTHDRVRRHQLGMRKTLVDVFVDDVRLIEDEIALDQHRHLAVRIDDGDIFLLGKQVDVDHLEIHALFVQDDATALTEWAGDARIEIHHGQYLKKTNRHRSGKGLPVQ